MSTTTTRTRPTGLPKSPKPSKRTEIASESLDSISFVPSNHLRPGLSPPPPPSSHHGRSLSQPPRTLPPSPRIRSFSSEIYRSRSRGMADATDSASSSPRMLSRPLAYDLPEPSDKARQQPFQSVGDKMLNNVRGDGSSIWDTVASAANALTISVSKAWNVDLTPFSGEETPPGRESRLTKAMKAYHIAKAQDPSDLPEWLFNESERGLIHGSGRTSADRKPTHVDNNPNIQSNERSESPRQLKGTDRLKALREGNAKFYSWQSGQSFDGKSDVEKEKALVSDSTEMPRPATKPVPRIGLPTGPRGGRLS